MPRTSRIQRLRDLSVEDRRTSVADAAGLDPAAIAAFDPAHGLTTALADHMIENVAGIIGVPIGVATNFVVNGSDVLVPMAIEEASVVAAASNAAKVARVHGGFTTSSTAPIMQAQVQIVGIADPEAGRVRLLEAREELIALADAQDPKLVEFGGGVRDIAVRLVPSRAGTYVVAHLQVDVRDAMGANAVNTMAEAVAARAAEIAGGNSLLRILTNKADLRLSRARAVFDAAALGGPGVVDNIIHAAALAEADPYRAATHNKGIMNGITAVVLATGNDTRAVEAGRPLPRRLPRRALHLAVPVREGRRRQRRRGPGTAHARRSRRRRHQGPSRRSGGDRPARRPHRHRARGDHHRGRPRAELRRRPGPGHRGDPARPHVPARPHHRLDGRGDPGGGAAVVARLIADKQLRADHAEKVLAELRAGR
ncbi:hydroxymethylglutaryl-CoA reductase, degradative [Actinomadura madurae]|nr:hydroxymethylglutaryl-CoA reductase, degradative [Actinomadura madurae]